jgi:L-lactate dehydrogenase complex protein LldF
MHKDRYQIAELFAAKLGLNVGHDPEALTQAARRVLRGRFLAADAGISGVNVAACTTGTLALITNEGNGRYCTTLPRVHIALMGFEKAVPTLEDLALLATYIPRAALGARLPSYVSVMNAAPAKGEAGPRERHLVILDNGRADILAGPHWEMLLCLRCATCLNFCPVYGLAGGHAYPGAYSGPMGAVLGQLLGGQGGGPELAQASSLCGRCRQMCPMGIDLPGMLLALRQGKASTPLGQAADLTADLAAGLAAQTLSRRPLFDAACVAGRGLIRVLEAWEPRPLPPGPWKRWRRGRRLPQPPTGRKGDGRG